jgi:hypothetical protein
MSKEQTMIYKTLHRTNVMISIFSLWTFRLYVEAFQEYLHVEIYVWQMTTDMFRLSLSQIGSVHIHDLSQGLYQE